MPIPNRWPEVRRCLSEALDLDGSARDVFMRELGIRDPTLAHAVEELLGAPEAETLAGVEYAERGVHGGVLKPGSRVGRYTLIDILGEGGFGVVWRAEQREPVRREVALKVIKPGMDSAAVVARFEAERQALAVMDHPNIAQVYDGGVTGQDSSRPDLPYFVMELVHGEPITDYCDRARLGIAARLDLFIKVCDAVQHAHTKAVIHRDLKPSNVLVSEQAGEVSVKVIDFGVAKALGQRLTERTLFTEQGQLVGTPEYMSPEQASGADIDTRSDVYSLGVILYELLTGRRPFDLQKAGLFEIQRVIREDDPPKPSTRLLFQDEAPSTASEVAAQRRTDPKSLARILRTDLDWVVMRCLEKDRARRYATASSLGEDIRRYLASEPVSAGPPTASYRLRKFVRRHKAGVGASSAFIMLLVLGSVLVGWLAVRAMDAESLATTRLGETARALERTEIALADAEAVSEFFGTVVRSLSPEERGRDVTMREVLDEAARNPGVGLEDRPLIEARLRREIGSSYRALGLPVEATPHLERAVALFRDGLGETDRSTLAAVDALAGAFEDAGDLPKAQQMFRENLRACRAEFGDLDPDTVRSMNNLAVLLVEAGELDEAETVFREALEAGNQIWADDTYRVMGYRANLCDVLWRLGKLDEAGTELDRYLSWASEHLRSDHPQRLAAMNTLANTHRAAGRLDEAEQLYREVLGIVRETFGPEHRRTLQVLNHVGGVVRQQGKFEEAEQLLSEALRMAKAVLGEDHPETLAIMNGLAGAYAMLEKYDDAEEIFLQLIDIVRVQLGETHPHTAFTIGNLAYIYVVSGRPELGAQRYAEALGLARQSLPPDHPDIANIIAGLGTALKLQGKHKEAESQYLEAYRILIGAFGPEHPTSQRVVETTIDLYERWGHEQDAAAWRARLTPPAPPAADVEQDATEKGSSDG